MDMSILLGLQDFRNGSGGFLAEFMKKMTFLGELNTTLVLLAILYWCIHKELGTFLMMGWCGNRLVNGALKVTACAYRPWIRDARIVPYGDSMTTATGYSFPSGHSMNAGSLFGGTAVRPGTTWGPRVLLFIVVALVGFSRMFLGVHTPQDVLVGIAASVLVMWLTAKLMKWIAKHPEKDWIVVVVGLGLSALLAVYAAVKPYPADYDANGQLIVDGAKMANDTFKAVGWTVGFLIGWILERRYVGFSTDVSLMKKLPRAVAGLLGFYAVSLILMPWIKQWIPGPAGTTVSCLVQMLYISFGFPWCIKHIEKEGRFSKKSKILPSVS